MLNLQLLPRTQKQWTVLLYSVTFIFLFADQNLLSPNLSAAAEDFGFNDMERDEKLGGNIAVAFFLVGAPASFIVGCLADSRYIRRNLLFGSIVLIGEGACTATYFTRSYTAFYVSRAITGFSVGGALPIISSVMGDWYPPEDQSTVMAYIGIAAAVGIAFGQGLSGMIGPKFGWRSPFLIVGLAAIVLAIVFMAISIEPKRSDDGLRKDESVETSRETLSEEDDYSPCLMQVSNSSHQAQRSSFQELDQKLTHSNLSPLMIEKDEGLPIDRSNILSLPNSFFQTFIQLVTTPTVLLALFQGAPGCFPWGVINTYLNDYLSSDIGMTVQGATFTLMIFSLGVFCGMLIGAYGGKQLYIMDVRYPSLLGGGMAILGCIPLWILINQNPMNQADGYSIEFWGFAWLALVALISGTCSGVTGPIIKAILQNVVSSNARGQAFAMFNTFDDFGRGLGPYFVAKLIASMGNRKQAFNIAVFGWIFCGVFVLCTFFTIKKDQEKVKRCNLEWGSSGQRISGVQII